MLYIQEAMKTEIGRAGKLTPHFIVSQDELPIIERRQSRLVR